MANFKTRNFLSGKFQNEDSTDSGNGLRPEQICHSAASGSPFTKLDHAYTASYLRVKCYIQVQANNSRKTHPSIPKCYLKNRSHSRSVLVNNQYPERHKKKNLNFSQLFLAHDTNSPRRWSVLPLLPFWPWGKNNPFNARMGCGVQHWFSAGSNTKTYWPSTCRLL